jgi:hypothetical protein
MDFILIKKIPYVNIKTNQTHINHIDNIRTRSETEIFALQESIVLSETVYVKSILSEVFQISPDEIKFGYL